MLEVLRHKFNEFRRLRNQKEREWIYSLNNQYVQNFYGSSFKKRALICYQPMSLLLPKKHWWRNKDSLHEQTVWIAEWLHQKGFQVDIIDADKKRTDFFGPYDLIFDILNNHKNYLEQAKNLGWPRPKIICHYTTAYYAFHNRQDLERYKEFNRKHGTHLSPARPLAPQNLDDCDHVLIMGNGHTFSTFPEDVKRKATLVPNTPLNYLLKYPKHRVTEKTKKRFLFMASSGAVFKGLDLIIDGFIEALKSDSTLELYLAGSFVAEKEFMHVYEPIIQRHPQIKIVGWLDLEKRKFKELYQKCSFHVFASCSEGMPGAVVSTMAVGLIPILTKESGIDTAGCGFEVEADSKSISYMFLRVSKFEVNTLEALSLYCASSVKEFVWKFKSTFYILKDDVKIKE